MIVCFFLNHKNVCVVNIQTNVMMHVQKLKEKVNRVWSCNPSMVTFSPSQLTQHLQTAGIPLKDNC